MDRQPILRASEVLPDESGRKGVLSELNRLERLLADLAALAPGDPAAPGKLHEAHIVAHRLYRGAAGNPNGGDPGRWLLAVLQELNAHASRLRLPVSLLPFELTR